MSFTIIQGKEGNTPKRPLILVAVTAPDGDVCYLTTAAYYGAPNIVYGGNTYLARILGNEIDAIAAVGPQGYDTVPGFTLTLGDADKSIWTNHCVPHGWRGSAITLTVILWDVIANQYSTDAIQWTFIGGNPQHSAADGKLSVDATSACNFSRLKVPSVPIQYRCPWAFPPDAPSRAAALNDPTSPYYQCGYSPDQPGGVGNYASGTTPFTTCDYTRSSPSDLSVGCMARMGKHTATSVAPDGDLCHDLAGHYTGRFGGVTWIAPTSFQGKSYTGGGTVFGFNQPNSAIVGSFYSWVYGTQWVNCQVLAPASDPNSTRAEAVVCFAPFGPATVIKLLVNGVVVPQGNSDQLFTWRYVTQGGRNGALEGDAIFDNHGDPHGSLCVIEFVVPIQLASGGSAPSVQALVTGPPILSLNSSLAFVYNAPDLFDTGIYQSNNIAGPAANPVFTYLDLMSWGNVPKSKIDTASFYTSSQLVKSSISYTAADGSTQSHAAFKASFQLAGNQRQTLAGVLTGLRNAANLMVAENGVTGLIQCFVKQTLADQQPAIVAGSNDTTARASVHASGSAGTGYYAYLFNESNIEKDSFRITSPKINAIPNTVAFSFQDEYNGYQQDSLTEVDPASYAYSGNQEINVPIPMLGIPNFDQGTRQANLVLGEALFGNPRNDAGGTLYFEFTVNHRVLGLASRLGYICGLTYQPYGIGTSSPQAIRLLSVKPDTDGEHWQIKAAWHNDNWYTTAYGQNPTPFQVNPLLGPPNRPPYPWAPAAFTWPSTDSLFPNKESFQLSVDQSSYPSQISVSGKLPVNAQPSTRPPLVPLQASTGNSGGSITPATYYVAVSTNGAIGPVSAFSVVVVPAGTNTNTITLSNLQWQSGAAPSPALFIGTTPMNMRLSTATVYTTASPDSNGNPTSYTITAIGADGLGLPDVAFACFQVTETAQRQGGVWGDTIQSVDSTGKILTLSGGYTVNQWSTYVLSLLYRPGVNPQPALNMAVSSNTANTLTMPATGFLAGDVVVLRFKAGSITSSTIGDANCINSYAPAGLANFAGCLLWIIAGTGAGYGPHVVQSNTATVFTISDTFDVMPDATSIFILLSPESNITYTTPALPNDGSLGVVQVGAVPALTTLQASLVVQVATVDGSGSFSPMQYQPFREVYIPPQTVGLSTLYLSVPGILSIRSDACPITRLPDAFTPTAITAEVKGAPTGAGVTVHLNYVTTGAPVLWCSLTIAAGTTLATATTAALSTAGTFPAGAKLTLDITGVGSSYPGRDLTVSVG